MRRGKCDNKNKNKKTLWNNNKMRILVFGLRFGRMEKKASRRNRVNF